MKPILQGWKDTQMVLWRVPILPKQSKANSKPQEKAKQLNLLNQNQMANNVYKLQSTKQIVCNFHAAAGFLTKAT